MSRLQLRLMQQERFFYLESVAAALGRTWIWSEIVHLDSKGRLIRDLEAADKDNGDTDSEINDRFHDL